MSDDVQVTRTEEDSEVTLASSDSESAQDADQRDADEQNTPAEEPSAEEDTSDQSSADENDEDDVDADNVDDEESVELDESDESDEGESDEPDESESDEDESEDAQDESGEELNEESAESQDETGETTDKVPEDSQDEPDESDADIDESSSGQPDKNDETDETSKGESDENESDEEDSDELQNESDESSEAESEEPEEPEKTEKTESERPSKELGEQATENATDAKPAKAEVKHPVRTAISAVRSIGHIFTSFKIIQLIIKFFHGSDSPWHKRPRCPYTLYALVFAILTVFEVIFIQWGMYSEKTHEAGQEVDKTTIRGRRPFRCALHEDDAGLRRPGHRRVPGRQPCRRGGPAGQGPGGLHLPRRLPGGYGAGCHRAEHHPQNGHHRRPDRGERPAAPPHRPRGSPRPGGLV